VLQIQYHVAWLGAYDAARDVFFLAGVAGIALTRIAARRGPAHVGAMTLRLLFAATVAGGALSAAELVTRYAFRHVTSSGNAADYFGNRAGGGPSISVNSLGFRDREPGPKDPKRYRIAVVGDSFTWGQGIEERDRFSNVLEGFLGARYEVLNLGIPGHDMPQHLEVLDQALPMRPDFVLLQLYINDFEMPGMERPRTYPLLPEAIDRTMWRSSILYGLLSGRWVQFQQAIGLVESYPHYMDRNLRSPDSPNSRQAFGMLQQFIDRARKAGVPSGAVLFPAADAMGPNGSDYPFGYLHDRVRQVCADQRIPCLDLLPAISTLRDPRSLWVSPFDAHPNAQANRRAAFEILKEFGSVWQR
jgi:lysophospholipase L1-like esterase